MRSRVSSMPLVIAAPIGVSPRARSQGGWKTLAVSNSVATFTGPKVMQATSTRFDASSSAISSSRKALRPAFSSVIGSPDIDPDTSSSSRHGHRGSGLSAKSSVPKGFWVTARPPSWRQPHLPANQP